MEHKQCDSEKLETKNRWSEHTRVILEDGRGFKGSTAMLKYQGRIGRNIYLLTHFKWSDKVNKHTLNKKYRVDE